MLKVNIEEKRFDDFIDKIVELCNQGKINETLTFDEVWEMAEKNKFDYYKVLYFLDDRGFKFTSKPAEVMENRKPTLEENKVEDIEGELDNKEIGNTPIGLSKRELKVIRKVLQEKAIDLRSRSDYYRNDEVQADYFEIDVLTKKIGSLNAIEDVTERDFDDEWDLEL